jgi:hypothetical protein
MSFMQKYPANNACSAKVVYRFCGQNTRKQRVFRKSGLPVLRSEHAQIKDTRLAGWPARKPHNGCGTLMSAANTPFIWFIWCRKWLERLVNRPFHNVFKRSMPSDLIRGWVPVRVRKRVKTKGQASGTSSESPKTLTLSATAPIRPRFLEMDKILDPRVGRESALPEPGMEEDFSKCPGAVN